MYLPCTHTENLPRTNTVPLVFGMDGQASSENAPGTPDCAPETPPPAASGRHQQSIPQSVPGMFTLQL